MIHFDIWSFHETTLSFYYVGLKKKQTIKYPFVKKMGFVVRTQSVPGVSQLQNYKLTIPSLMSYQMTVTVEVW